MNLPPLVFIDTETTGFEEPRAIEVAYLRETEPWASVFRIRPPKRIELQAMAVHHITEGMVAGCVPFWEHPQSLELRRLIEEGILVAHFAPYDIEVLEREGIPVPRFIDTKAAAMELFPELEQHRLQFLRYALDANVIGAAPHTAGGDVMVLRSVFERVVGKLMERSGKSREEAISNLIHTA